MFGMDAELYGKLPEDARAALQRRGAILLSPAALSEKDSAFGRDYATVVSGLREALVADRRQELEALSDKELDDLARTSLRSIAFTTATSGRRGEQRREFLVNEIMRQEEGKSALSMPAGELVARVADESLREVGRNPLVLLPGGSFFYWGELGTTGRVVAVGTELLGVVPGIGVAAKAGRLGFGRVRAVSEGLMVALNPLPAIGNPLAGYGHVAAMLADAKRIPTASAEIRSFTTKFPQRVAHAAQLPDGTVRTFASAEEARKFIAATDGARTYKVPASDLIAARESAVADMMLQGKRTADFPGAPGEIRRATFTNTRLNQIAGPRFTHSTPFGDAFMEAWERGESVDLYQLLYGAPDPVLKYAAKPAGGPIPHHGRPISIWIDPKMLKELDGLVGTGKLHKDYGEIEAGILKGIKLPPPSQFLRIRGTLGDLDVISLTGQGVRPRASVIIEGDRGVMLVRGKGDKAFLLPGGGVDSGTPEATAIREIAEETGQSVASIRRLGQFQGLGDPLDWRGANIFHNVYSAKVKGTPKPAHEIGEVAYWKPGSELPVSKDTKAILEQAQSGKAFADNLPMKEGELGWILDHLGTTGGAASVSEIARATGLPKSKIIAAVEAAMKSPTSPVRRGNVSGDILVAHITKNPITPQQLAKLKVLGPVDTVKSIFRPSFRTQRIPPEAARSRIAAMETRLRAARKSGNTKLADELTEEIDDRRDALRALDESESPSLGLMARPFIGVAALQWDGNEAESDQILHELNRMTLRPRLSQLVPDEPGIAAAREDAQLNPRVRGARPRTATLDARQPVPVTPRGKPPTVPATPAVPPRLSTTTVDAPPTRVPVVPTRPPITTPRVPPPGTPPPRTPPPGIPPPPRTPPPRIPVTTGTPPPPGVPPPGTPPPPRVKPPEELEKGGRDKRRVAFDIPGGEFPRLVGWRQGAFYEYIDLTTGDRQTSGKPLYGVVPASKGLSPFDSLRVIDTSKRRPSVRTFRMGFENVRVDGRVAFQLSRDRSRRPAAAFGRGRM
jgi:ADP-ribose pyrophosphatase YjhB (NUDIX family)